MRKFLSVLVSFTMLFSMLSANVAYAKPIEDVGATEAESPHYIQVAMKMLEMAGEEPAINKFKLFDEYSSFVSYPPDGSAGNIAKPTVNSSASSNDNVWRTPGASYYTAVDNTGNNMVRLKFGDTSQYKIQKIYLFDGPVYAPSTYTTDGSAPYEVMGGSIAVYGLDGTLLGSYTSTNKNDWVSIDLTGAYPDGYATNGLKFVKASQSVSGTTSMYSWSDGGTGIYSKQFYCDIDIPEVMLYGTKVEGSGVDYNDSDAWRLEDDKVPAGTPVTGGQGLDFGDFVGTNSFFTENQSTYEILGAIREYHSWSWTDWTANDRTDANGQKSNLATSATPQATFIDGWGFDSYYKSLHDKGIEVGICVQGGALGAPTSRPSYQSTDTRSPGAYLAHAQNMFQLAARYGSNKNVDPNLVHVAAGTSKQIGLGYVNYFENYNEGNLGSFSGAQFAAMTSADYDGHMGTMGPGVGVKAADPNAKLVLGGLAGIIYNTSYNSRDWTALQFVADMMKWFDANRTEEQWKAAHNDSLAGYVKYPFDVLNGHYYCPDGYALSGLSPEADHLYERMTDFTQFRNDYFPDKELWLSEFGWDSAQGSSQSATVNSTINVGLTGQEVQGRWLVREYLMLAAAGIDRALQFMMPDTSNDPNNPGRFATCGFINGVQGSTSYKPSWYYVGTMNHLLKDMEFDSVVADGGQAASGGGATDVETNGPWVLKFKGTSGTDTVYALWLPTSLGDQGGANKQDYTITLPATADHATLVTLKDKVKWGELTDITNQISDGKITVQVSEKPVFVVTTQGEYSNPTPEILNAHNFTVRSLTASSGDPAKLFEEYCSSTDARPQENGWNPGGVNRYAVVDLGAKYDLTDIYVWDRSYTLAAGKVYAAYAYKGTGQPTLNPGNMTSAQVQTLLAGGDWQKVAAYNFGGWEVWADGRVSAQTRYLILGFEDGPENTLPHDQWEQQYIAVPEMMIKGSLARGETPPPPYTRTFEPKPSYAENNYLFDNDFDGTHNDAYTTYGATVTEVAGTNANGTAGKVLKYQGTTASPEFKIPATALSAMKADTWYYVDYKLKLEDTNSAPKLAMLNTWSPIYSNSGGGNRFKPQWSPDTSRVTVIPNEWHQLKAKIKISSTDHHIDYEVFYDGVSIGAAVTTMAQALPLDGILIQMVADPNTGRSTYYLDDVWVYSPKPKTTLLEGTFDDFALGNFSTGHGFVVESNYAQQSAIIQPSSGNAFYLENGDQLLKVPQDAYVLNTTDVSVLSEIRIGQPYVFDFSFYTTSARTAPTIQLLYDGWKRHGIADTNWQGGIAAATSDLVQRLPAVNIAPEPNKWHRIVVKYEFVTATKIKYSYYYDDMDTPVAANIVLDSTVGDSSKPDANSDPTRQMSFLSNNLAATMGFLVGTTTKNPDSGYAVYFNDMSLYQADAIKAWPAKYLGVDPITAELTFGFDDAAVFDASPESVSFTFSANVYDAATHALLTAQSDLGALGLVSMTADGEPFTGFTQSYDAATRTYTITFDDTLTNKTYALAIAGGKLASVSGEPVAAASRSFTVQVIKEITGFSAIPNIDGGDTLTPTYASAEAVEAALPVTVTATTADGTTVDVPVASWADTEGYAAGTAGTYTFTAVLGELPVGFANAGSHTATAKVVVEQGLELRTTLPAALNIIKHDTLQIPLITNLDPAQITYVSNNTRCVTVSATGLIKGFKAGTATITVSGGGLSFQLVVTCVNNANKLDDDE